MTANDLAAACPTCAAQPGLGCISTDGQETPLPYIHFARIEASAFVLGLEQPGDAHPITDAQIDATGLV